ncbi:MAG: hypothetical protein JKY65_11290 [Planctomycetes bacterium]|nr:hypothetical protein [Planctomycetota bacterium]
MRFRLFGALAVIVLALSTAWFAQATAQESLPSATPTPSAAPAPATPPDQPKAPQPVPQVDPSPAAIGGLAGMSAFMACGYLGELADGLAAGRDSAWVEARAAALARGLIVNMRQLESVGAMGNLDPAAHAQLAALRRLLAALGEQAKFLELYSVTQEPTMAETYRELRERTWSETGRLLGLNKAAAASLAPGGSTLGLPKAKATPTPTPSKD